MLLPDYKYDYGQIPRIETLNKSLYRRILGLHISGHDASAAVLENDEIVEVIEFERIYREKRCRIYPSSIRFDRSLDWLFSKYRLNPKFDAVAIQVNSFRKQSFEIAVKKLKLYIPDAHYIILNHHLCHAASVYFTSPFQRASIFSYDGQGNDGTTLGFFADGNCIEYVKFWPINFGASYRALGSIIGDIHESDNHTAGKTMGLTAYGDAVELWKEPTKKFIRDYWPMREKVATWEPSIVDDSFYLENYGPVKGHNTFGGPISTEAQNFAKTFQVCWSEIARDCIRELIKTTGCRKLCVVGGSALNVITNRLIADMVEVEDIQFIPNCNDSGIAMGAALYCNYTYQGKIWKGSEREFNPYKGVPILDLEHLEDIVIQRQAKLLTDPHIELAELLVSGKIIGILLGRSELGPRALGNRSILCNPKDLNVKRRLETIKGREWFRPFAPIVREEDQTVYFDIDRPVPYMSMIGYIKPEWRDTLAAVTHVDGSARLQTVNKTQNLFLWELLGELKRLTGIGILLNTSFNEKGDPMITSITDALRLLDQTGLDALYCEGWMFSNEQIGS